MVATLEALGLRLREKTLPHLPSLARFERDSLISARSLQIVKCPKFMKYRLDSGLRAGMPGFRRVAEFPSSYPRRRRDAATCGLAPHR